MAATNGPGGERAEAPATVTTDALADKLARLEVVKQEKEARRVELLDYNKRLDRTIVLYLTAAYAAIGLQVSGKLDLSQCTHDDRYVLVAFGFIFLNSCILLHALSQIGWCMAIAKFIHLKLDREIERLLGAPAIGGGDGKARLREVRFRKWDDEVGFLGWDDWGTDVKGIANSTRNSVSGLWVLLVLAASFVSLIFVDVPHFIATFPCLGYLSIVGMIALHLFVLQQAVWLFFYTVHYHDIVFDFSRRQRLALWGITLGLTGAIFILGYVAAVWL